MEPKAPSSNPPVQLLHTVDGSGSGLHRADVYACMTWLLLFTVVVFIIAITSRASCCWPQGNKGWPRSCYFSPSMMLLSCFLIACLSLETFHSLRQVHGVLTTRGWCAHNPNMEMPVTNYQRGCWSLSMRWQGNLLILEMLHVTNTSRLLCHSLWHSKPQFKWVN